MVVRAGKLINDGKGKVVESLTGHKAHWGILVERQQGAKVKGNKRKDGRVWGLGSGSEVKSVGGYTTKATVVSLPPISLSKQTSTVSSVALK